MDGDRDRLLDAAEVARLLKCSEKTVMREVNRGNLDTVRIGKLIRFRPEDVQARMNTKSSPKAPSKKQIAPAT